MEKDPACGWGLTSVGGEGRAMGSKRVEQCLVKEALKVAEIKHRVEQEELLLLIVGREIV